MLLCYKCKHFQIRYLDSFHKYGCKALGFKSPDSNWYWLHMPCPYFEENPKRLKNNKTTVKKNFDNNNNLAAKEKKGINIII